MSRPLSCAGTATPHAENNTTDSAPTFVTSLSDHVAQPLTFDPDWCAAVCGVSDDGADDPWTVDLDNKGTRAEVTQRGYDTLTLRSATSLPHAPRATAASFRVVVEDYGDNEYCTLGFVPSGAEAVVGREICEYGGWYISVAPSRPRRLLYSSAFAPLAADDAAAKAFTIPPVPPGSAVEFTVDYTAHTCRVAFYDPAHARNFGAAPNATAMLRFVPTEEYGSDPARPDPTAAGTCVALFPAVGMRWGGGRVSFAGAEACC
jgi:hypothetical protein